MEHSKPRNDEEQLGLIQRVYKLGGRQKSKYRWGREGTISTSTNNLTTSSTNNIITNTNNITTTRTNNIITNTNNITTSTNNITTSTNNITTSTSNITTSSTNNITINNTSNITITNTSNFTINNNNFTTTTTTTTSQPVSKFVLGSNPFKPSPHLPSPCLSPSQQSKLHKGGLLGLLKNRLTQIRTE
ncbi:hypothetical protein Pcinc_004487 [Petrolisthes cinctipes]|uniref:Uncharacterized protein n=1 Tax=Petrolisthes cinctipes TaxID=88211 RepID=A0AAE1L3P1_PETCI|nr:hypothetical protein Pcinc_004487 [Petrolisthes cinctipes]